MSDFETISGDKAANLIEILKQSKVLVKVSVPKTDYGQLTVITDIARHGGDQYFQIDPPQGFQSALDQSADQKLRFEFSSSNRLPHRFETVAKTLGKETWFLCPEHIQRFQLRDNFRIKAPADAHVAVNIGHTPVNMTVDNISLGGLFCHCPNSVKQSVEVGLKLSQLKLGIHFDGEGRAVTVSRAVVRRLDGRTKPRHFGVALEFLSLKNEERKRLTQIVYDLQREQLRSRLKEE